MIGTNFRTDFEVGFSGQEGIGALDIKGLEGTNLDVLQGEIRRELGQKQEQIEGYLHSHGIVIDERAIHEEIEEIMDMDKDALDALERDIKTKLERKMRELKSMVKAQ